MRPAAATRALASYARTVTLVESTVELASGLRLSCASVGAPEGPTVVLLPGPTDSWRSYDEVLHQLPEAIHAVAVSCRGHGDSDKPATGYRVADFCIDVVQLLDALSVEQAVVAGHSGSCMTARRLAIGHPERVAGLVLEASPATLVGNTTLESFVSSVINELNDPIDPAFAASLIADTSTTSLAPEVLDVLVDEVMKVPAHVWREMFGALVTYDDLVELPRIQAPALLVWGDADQLVPRDAQDTLMELLPNASLSVYPGVGHTPRWEVPERFAGEVASFALETIARPALPKNATPE